MSYVVRDPYYRPDPYANRNSYSQGRTTDTRFCPQCQRATWHQDAGRQDSAVEMCADCGNEGRFV